MSNVLGYISSTRKKSCRACVKSKRRCDLGYPYCKRCFSKSLECEYPNASSSTSSSASAASPRRRKRPFSHEENLPAEVVLRQGTPELQQPIISVVTSTAAPDFVLDPIFDIASTGEICFGAAVESSSGSGSSSSPESFEIEEVWDVQAIQAMPQPQMMQYPAPQLTRELTPTIVIPSYLSDEQVFYVVQAVREFVPNMAYSGTTTFLHKNLYQSHGPEIVQDCVAISALYMAQNTRNQRILASTIESKIASLIATSSTWTLQHHLAAVQALIIYQVIRLFDKTLNLQSTAVKHNVLLELWTATLWKRFFNEPQSHTSCYTAFIFNESVRRTVIMSVFVRCAWSCVTRNGLCDQIHVLSRLPLTQDFGAWKFEDREWNGMDFEKMRERETLCSYEDLAERWRGTEDVGGLDPFAKLLLAACVGKQDPRLLT